MPFLLQAGVTLGGTLAAAVAETFAGAPGDPIACLSCGRSFLYRGPDGDSSGRFCCARCREWYDAGGMPQPPIASSVQALNRFPVSPRIIRQGPRGAIVTCRSCGREFDSLGLATCSDCRERKPPTKAAQAAQGALVDTPSTRDYRCVVCAGKVPVKRTYSATTRDTCCAAHTSVWRKAAKSQEGGEPRVGVSSDAGALAAQGFPSGQKPDRPSLVGPRDMPIDIVGGSSPRRATKP
jgi:hypothetical protein